MPPQKSRIVDYLLVRILNYFCFSVPFSYTVESVSTSTSSQVSSPVCSRTSSPFPSPFPSPLPSPNLAHSKRGEADLGISVLSSSHDTASEHDTPGSNDESPAMRNQWRERRDSGVGNSLTRPNR